MSPTIKIQMYPGTLRITVSLVEPGAGTFMLFLPFVFWEGKLVK